jgi:hypothetical protein
MTKTASRERTRRISLNIFLGLLRIGTDPKLVIFSLRCFVLDVRVPQDSTAKATQSTNHAVPITESDFANYPPWLSLRWARTLEEPRKKVET